jgi:acyl-CoA synthetase (AMP-forming)/AMP-acid ligase II
MKKSMTSATTLFHRLETDAESIAFLTSNKIWTYGRLASEIEHLGHPAVHEAAVVGVPDPVLGERVAGLVQLSACAPSVEPDEILDFATERLADYKVPETLQIVDQIPRNTLGKIDRQSVLTMILNYGSPDDAFRLSS